MIQVHNAVIMAAGMSSRLAPISYEKPKALLTIKGEILIERQIRQMQEAGIMDITVIVGYHKEQFAYLQKKFGVTLVENPCYKERNNHSSLYFVRDQLSDTYISCADFYFYQNPFRNRVEKPYYSTIYQAGNTNEWCVYTVQSGKIKEVLIGGADAWVMRGEAFFDKAFSEKLKPLLEYAFMDPASADTYWEDLYVKYIDEMELYERRDSDGNVMEFDSLEELRKQAPEYEKASGCRIMERIAEELHCREGELQDFQPVKRNGQIEGVNFSYGKNRYCYWYEARQIKELTDGCEAYEK